MIALSFPSFGLVGSFSPHVENNTFQFHGEIPSELGGLFWLRVLVLGDIFHYGLTLCHFVMKTFLFERVMEIMNTHLIFENERDHPFTSIGHPCMGEIVKMFIMI